MRSIAAIAVVLLAVSPVLGDAITYTYQVTSGTLTLDVEPNDLVVPDPVTMAGGGTFAVTFYSDDDEIGESDTFVIQSAALSNAESVSVDVLLLGSPAGTITAQPGGLYISQFSVVTPGHLDADGIGSTLTDVFGGGNVDVYIPGLYVGPASDNSWSVQPETYDLDFDIVGGLPVSVTMDGTFTYEYTIPGMLGEGPEFGHGVEMNAILIPEPGTVGLLFLGMAALLRRRE